MADNQQTKLADKIYGICLLEKYTDDPPKTARNQTQHIMALVKAHTNRLLQELMEQKIEYYVIDEGGYEAEKDPTIAVPVSVIQERLEK